MIISPSAVKMSWPTARACGFGGVVCSKSMALLQCGASPELGFVQKTCIPVSVR
jgi:hypothetical protein